MERTEGRTDRQTDGCQTVTLCLLLDMTSVTKIPVLVQYLMFHGSVLFLHLHMRLLCAIKFYLLTYLLSTC